MANTQIRKQTDHSKHTNTETNKSKQTDHGKHTNTETN